MKRIVYALIAIDLILFMALMWVNTDPEISLLPPVQGVEQLVLVSEKTPAKIASIVKVDKAEVKIKAPEAGKKEAVQVQVDAGQCYQMAYFTSHHDAEAALSGMNTLGYKTRLDTIYPEKGRLLVYLPSFQDIEQARKVTQELRSKGIKDYQILAIKGSTNAISLGVFSHADTAKERIKEISRLGYEPVVQSVVGPPIKYRVYFYKINRSILNKDERQFLINSFKKVKINTIKCES